MKQAMALLLMTPLALILGCEVGPDYHPPKVELPDQFSEIGSATRPTTQPTTRSATQPAGDMDLTPSYHRWWTTFNDAMLDRLIERARLNNLDLKAAEARVLEARAQHGVVAAGLWPVANAAGAFTNSRINLAAEGVPVPAGMSAINTNLWQAGFDASWELDVFGGTRRAIEAATYSAQAADEDRRNVQVTLFAEVAMNYIELRGAQRQLFITRQNLTSQQQTLVLTRSRAVGGLTNFLDVAQQEAQVSGTAAQIPSLEAQVRGYVHQLSLLLGLEPGALSAELTPEAPVPVGPDVVPPGLPSDLLRRRPDVRLAERQLAAATANIGAATADLFPKFSLTGAGGWEALTMANLFDWNSRYYSVGPSITWEIFDANRIHYNINLQDAKQLEMLAMYRQAVLQSLTDVDNALVNYNREQLRRQELAAAVVANQKALDLSNELYQKGANDFLSVLDAERSLFAAQSLLTMSEMQVSADLVALYKALGGGWDVAEKK